LGWDSSNLIGGIPRVFFGFSLGIVIYRAVSRNQFGVLTKIKSASDRLIHHPSVLFVLVVLVLACPTEMAGLYPALMLLTLIPWFIVIGSRMACEGNWQRRVSLFLGWMSYPIYCLHYPIGRAIFLISDDAGYSHGVALIASVICTLVCAAIIAKVYDGPVRVWLSSKLWGSRRLYATAT
jgi:peptidoglycan/LPS O-acetylase OafA/YrhL